MRQPVSPATQQAMQRQSAPQPRLGLQHEVTAMEMQLGEWQKAEDELRATVRGVLRCQMCGLILVCSSYALSQEVNTADGDASAKS
jgi:hypothetical protein